MTEKVLERVCEIFEASGMSQRQLSLKVGVTQQHISYVLRGLRKGDAEFWQAMEVALGFEIVVIERGLEPPSPEPSP